MSWPTTASPWTKPVSRSRWPTKKKRAAPAPRTKSVQDVSVYVAAAGDLRRQGAVGPEGVEHRIYDSLSELDTTVVGIIRDGEIVSEANLGDEVEIVLPATPFYVESGGQVSDTGEIYYFPDDVEHPVYVVAVTDTRRRIPGLIAHIGKVTTGTVRVGDPALAVIDADRRWDIMRNHTATHVLHAALRERLGDHVHQAGSLVEPDPAALRLHPHPARAPR